MQNSDIDADGINEVPDLNPVEIPGRNIDPSLEDRLSQVEQILNIGN